MSPDEWREYLASLRSKFEVPSQLEIVKAYWTLRQASTHQTGAGEFVRKFLKSIVGPEQIEVSDLTLLDQDNADAAMTLFIALASRCGEIRDLVWENPSDEELTGRIEELNLKSESSS